MKKSTLLLIYIVAKLIYIYIYNFFLSVKINNIIITLVIKSGMT
jgi:hypothetical protein